MNIAGWVTGGALVGTGVALLIVDMVGAKRTRASDVALRSTASGFEVRF